MPRCRSWRWWPRSSATATPTFGPVGALVAAWPAGALVGSYELLMVIIRQSASGAPVPEPGAPHPPALSNGHAAPEGGQEAARIFADELSRGESPSIGPGAA